MSRRVQAPDRGASALEYAAVLVLVAALVATLLSALDRQANVITAGIEGAIERIFGGEGTEGGATSADAPDGGTGPSGDDGWVWEDNTPADDASAGGASAEPGGQGAEGGGVGLGDGAWQGQAPWSAGFWESVWELGDWVRPGGVPDVDFNSNSGSSGNFFEDFVAGVDREVRRERGVPGGLMEGIWDDLRGAVESFGALVTNPVETVAGAVEAIREDPLSLLISPETREHWQEGDYFSAIGRGIWDVGSWFIPGPGWLGKGGSLLRLGRGVPDAPDTPSTGRNDAETGTQQRADGEDGPDGNRNDNDNDNNNSCRTGNSFLPGTPVLMANGTHTEIESVEVGDEVWAFNPLTGAEGPREVTHLIEGDGPKTLVEITITDTKGATDTLTATDGHPFWLPETAEWVDAIDLEPGTWLRTSTGTWVQATAVDTWDARDQRVHNLTIAEIHTYYVGVDSTAILVHNAPGGCPEGRAPEDPNIGANNYRGRYQAWLSRNGYERLPRDWDAHHAIPQAYRNHPDFQDFDFDAPSNIRGIPGSRYGNRATNIHQNITREWEWFQDRNPNATRAEIEEFAENIDARYNDYYWRETESVD